MERPLTQMSDGEMKSAVANKYGEVATGPRVSLIFQSVANLLKASDIQQNY